MITLMSLFVVQATDATAVAAQGIGPVALAFMLLSMGSVATLTFWCFYRILSTRQHFDPDGTGPAKPPIAGEADPRDSR